MRNIEDPLGWPDLDRRPGVSAAVADALEAEQLRRQTPKEPTMNESYPSVVVKIEKVLDFVGLVSLATES